MRTSEAPAKKAGAASSGIWLSELGDAFWAAR